MYIREKDGMIAVYRNLDLMMDTFQSNTYKFMMNAHFVIEVNPGNPRFGIMKKDWYGIFSDDLVPVKKVLEIINFLYESEQNANK